MLAGPLQQRFDFRAGLQRIELLDCWLIGGIFCNDIRGLTTARVRTGGDSVGIEAAVSERLHDFRVAIDALGSKFPERIVGPARVAAFSGPGVSCDVDEHGWIEFGLTTE